MSCNMRMLAVALLQLVAVRMTNSKPGCTDVLEGCCDQYGGRDCDFIPFNNMLAGLQCLPPTSQQCSQMYVDCLCPVNNAAIDNWEVPCVPVPNLEQRYNEDAGQLETGPATFMFDSTSGNCVTCEQWTPTQNSSSSGARFQVGDFPCVVFNESVQFRCVDGDVGAVSGLACPNTGVADPESEQVLEFFEQPTLDCGDHGELVSVHGYDTCYCPPVVDPQSGKEISCWQTNRERSNRWPNGNIKIYCTVSLCDFDSSGAVVQVGLSGNAYESEQSLGFIDELARSLGVSSLIVYGCAFFLIVAVLCILYDLTLGKDANAQLREHMSKPKDQRKHEKRTRRLGFALNTEEYLSMKGLANEAKNAYMKDFVAGETHSQGITTQGKPWNGLTPEERRQYRHNFRQGQPSRQDPSSEINNPMLVDASPRGDEDDSGSESFKGA